MDLMNFDKKYGAAAAMVVLLSFVSTSYAAFDENLQGYTLDTILVEADATKDKFGNTITEQSYYRTGGDVKVITREEIEKRHYTDLTEAIKRIPGVTFQNPGYRGGEYGYAIHALLFLLMVVVLIMLPVQGYPVGVQAVVNLQG